MTSEYRLLNNSFGQNNLSNESMKSQMVEQGAHWSAGGTGDEEEQEGKQHLAIMMWTSTLSRWAARPPRPKGRPASDCATVSELHFQQPRGTASHCISTPHSVVHRGAYRGCRPTQVLYGAARLEWRRGHLKARCGLTLRPQFKDGEHIVWKSRSWNTIRIRLTYRFSVHVCSRAHVCVHGCTCVCAHQSYAAVLPCAVSVLLCAAPGYMSLSNNKRNYWENDFSNPEDSNRNLLKRYVLEVHSTASP